MGLFDSIKRKFGLNISNRNGVNEEYINIYNKGKTLRKKYYMKGGRYNGMYESYIGSGDDIWASIKISYKNDLKDGQTKYYWKKNISAEGNFSKGKEVGIINKYFRYEDELKDTKLHPVVKECANLNDNTYKVFSLNGDLLEKSEIEGVIFTEGSTSSGDGCYGGIYPIRNGLSEKWFDNGQLKEKGEWGKNNTTSIYNLSHRKGEHISYHDNGNVLKVGEWVGKQPIGIHKFYYPSGNIEFEIEYSSPKKKVYDGSFPDAEKINSEKWYNEDGSLMNVEEIITKGGIDPRKKQRDSNIRISWSKTLNEESVAVINNTKFKRMGQIKFYDSYYKTDYSLGHSYEVKSKSGVKSSANNKKIKKDFFKAESISNENADTKVEKILLQKISNFDQQFYADLYKIDLENFEIKYWYNIILKRVEIGNSMSGEMKKEYSDYELKSLVWGHADEYGKKHINQDFEFKKIIALSRIICFGHIFSVLLEIKNDSKSYSKISKNYSKEIDERLFHSKASVYGAIKFALFSEISKENIKDWFPLFEDNEELIMGVNSLEDAINDMITKNDPDNKNLKKLQGIYDGEKRVQIYELSKSERKNIPNWFKGPFYLKGGNVKSKSTENEFELNALEKSIFTEIQYNTALIQIMSEISDVSRETFENPFFKYLVQVVDEGTIWFKNNNTTGFSKLFEQDEGALNSLNNNDDKLVIFIGLMVSLVQQDDIFCDQEKIYIEEFVSQLSESKRAEITEKLKNQEIDGLISSVKNLQAEDQNELLNKLIELAAIDNKIDGKEAYLICYLAKTINLDVDQVINHMVESFNFETKLLDEEISRMNTQVNENPNGNNLNFNQENKQSDTSNTIGYRRHSKM